MLAHTKEVVAFTRRTGTELGPATATMQSRGDIMVRLVPRGDRDDIRDVIERVREELHAKVPEARFEYVQVLQDVLDDLAGNPAPIEIKVLGDDPQALDAYAEAAGEKLEKLPELTDFFDGREGLDADPRRARVDHDAARAARPRCRRGRRGLTIALVGTRGRADPSARAHDRRAAALPRRRSATTPRRSRARRSPTARGRCRSAPSSRSIVRSRPRVLRRDGLRPAVVMTAATKTGDLGGAEAAVRAALREHPGAAGHADRDRRAGGLGARRAQRARRRRGSPRPCSCCSSWCSSCNRCAFALVVLVGAPLSTVGGLLVLAMTGIPLDVSSMTGLILLVGLVVKNGILLLENAQHHVAEGIRSRPRSSPPRAAACARS